MISTLIIEDEKPAAQRIEEMLKKLEPDIIVAEKLDTVESAIEWLGQNPQPDLIMLDIQLGDGLSFDIFKKTKVESYIIFTTAYDEYAIRAFELNSIDYLLKPVSEQKLARSLEKFRKYNRKSPNIDVDHLIKSLDKWGNRFKKRFVIFVAGRISVIETGKIAWFSSKDKNTFLCSDEKRLFPIDYSLDQVEGLVNPETFFRVNRQYIVHFNAIKKINIFSKSRIKITISPPPDDEILVSAARTHEFRQWLER